MLTTYGWNIEYETQPPQSPEINKLDLSLFYSLQTQSEKLKTIERVNQAYCEYDID